LGGFSFLILSGLNKKSMAIPVFMVQRKNQAAADKKGIQNKSKATVLQPHN